MTTGRSKEFGTLLLVSLSAAALTAARVESSTSLAWMLGTSTFFIAVPWFVWAGLRTRLAGFLEFLFPTMCILWTFFPLAAEVILRKVGIGEAPEMTRLVCLQNTALLIGAFSHRARFQQVACLFAGFLALFATATGTTPAVYVLAGLFGVLLLWWLMARYWERVQQTVAAGQTDRCLPLRSSVMGGVVLVSALMLVLLGSTSASTYVIRGFMPSSGGDRWSDEFARAGVGDGDAMVAAKEKAMSFGPVESELFLDSEMPTLYDMFNDSYGEPPKPKKKQERNIGLAPGEVQETEQRTAKTERSGREFSVLRRQVERKQEALDDRPAAAMIYVAGRTPLHLALERYDAFDGRDWTHSGTRYVNPPIRLEENSGKPWARYLSIGASPFHRGLERHAAKIINLKTNRFPSPPQLTAIHVDKIDRPEFFGWTDDSVAHMPVREQIPQLTVVHLISQGLNLEPLRVYDFTDRFPRADRVRKQGKQSAVETDAEIVARHTESSVNRDLLSRTVAEWTDNVPRGWRQVEAVVQRLRESFRLDRQATAPENCADVVSHFLTERRGPAYLFATTAAVGLRGLGYPTRLVTGFYARRDRFDRRAGQTAVLAEDVHVWAEVYIGGNTWVAIEPTPGYEHPAENLTWRQWATAWAFGVFGWCRQHVIVLLAVAAGLVVAVKTRRDWLAFLGSVICGLLGMQSVEARLRWTIRLISWRAWLVGCQRPSQKTITAWYSPLMRAGDVETQRSVRRFFLWSERLLYSESAIDPEDRHDIAHACRAAVAVGHHRRLRTCSGANSSKPS